MKAPCTCCIYMTTRIEGHRKFTGCSDADKKKGFNYDNFFYHHKCENQEVKKECKGCIKYDGTYCNNNYVICKPEYK